MAAPLPAPVPRPGSLSVRNLAVPVLLSVAALGAILYFTYEPGVFGLLAASLRPGLLALALVALVAQLAFGGLRLRYISHGVVPFRMGVRAQLAWEFMSAVTPSAIGGAPLASYFVAKDNGISVGSATAMMLFSMLLDQVWFALTIPAILVATAFIDVFPPALGEVGAGTLTAYFLVLLAFTGFFAYATVIRPEVIEGAMAWVTRRRWLRRFEARVAEEMVRLKEQAKALRGQPPGFFVVGAALASGVWLFRYLFLLFLAWSVTPGLAWTTFLFRTGALWLTALAVPTPGGSGGMEGLFVLFLAPLLPPGFSGPVLLVWRLLSYHLFLVLGLFVTSHTIRTVVSARRADARADARAEAAPSSSR
ncbi:MAG TPA: lysylphosphatidylglycerol synthase transmembrane domain-containing protein [Rubricoccaceae bacterium]|nr:lysylphosphatidylglycerol synthase transmembrane domain-containing protein [Rubricoccaceae bacterium]